ncbi:DUF3093 family protein [Glutamicibacter soli]|uniref:DUF3093 family protein n=1 Tax=Glutamicibacter soli TaxID=453836 RepID=A0A6L9G7P4_9MICC|nr:DUF3093 family protein [Glutamicibacter soli]NAZ16645.1 DUF3093 family protein [Glutamicibacter soli]
MGTHSAKGPIISTEHIEVKNRQLIVVLMLLPIAIVVLTRMVLGDSLPAITATHWSEGKYPDGFTATNVFFAANGTMAIAGGAAGLIGLALRSKPLLLLILLFAGSLTAWMAASLVITCAVPTAIAGDPTLAENGPWIFASVVMTLISIAPLWLCGVFQEYSRRSRDKRRERIEQATGRRQPAQQAATAPASTQDFEQTATGPWWIWLLGFFALGMGIFSLSMADFNLGAENWVTVISSLAIILVVTPLVLGLAKIRVTVKDDKLRVSSAIFGFSLRTIKVEDIESVSSEEILPMEWGGWGWRIFPGGSAVVLKRSQGLAVELKDKKRFAVTIGDSQQAAARLHTLMKQR